MQPLQRIRMISQVFRYLLIGAGTAIVGAVLVGLIAAEQDWLSIGDGQLAQLLQSGGINGYAATALLAPVGAVFVLGIYWLQRLFAAYAAGNFFTDESMRCYLWLVWLKVASFAYHLLLPLLLHWIAQPDKAVDAELIVDAGTLVELVVLLLIVHLLREAQRINEENKGFI